MYELENYSEDDSLSGSSDSVSEDSDSSDDDKSMSIGDSSDEECPDDTEETNTTELTIEQKKNHIMIDKSNEKKEDEYAVKIIHTKDKELTEMAYDEYKLLKTLK